MRVEVGLVRLSGLIPQSPVYEMSLLLRRQERWQKYQAYPFLRIINWDTWHWCRTINSRTRPIRKDICFSSSRGTFPVFQSYLSVRRRIDSPLPYTSWDFFHSFIIQKCEIKNTRKVRRRKSRLVLLLGSSKSCPFCIRLVTSISGCLQVSSSRFLVCCTGRIMYI